MAKKKGENYAVVDLSGQSNFATLGAGMTSGEVIVTIAGTKIPVAQFSMTYGLNAIPQATVLVALGRNARTQKPSTIYDIVEKVKQMAEAVVEIEGDMGDWTPRGGGIGGGKQKWPRGPAIIFMGYVSGLTYRRSSGRVTLVISLTQQLIDLTMSSGGSKDVVPGAPDDLLLPTLTPGPGGEHAGCADTKYANKLESELTSDYSKAFLDCLHFVSKDNKLQSHSRLSWCPGSPLGSAPTHPLEGNIRVARILEGYGKWFGVANFSKSGGKDGAAPYTDTYPLQVPASAIKKAAITISKQISASLSATSIWGLMTNSVLPDYGCGVIPMSQAAIVAPILPIAQEHQITISPDDYVDFDLTCMSQRPLYGVGVISTYQLATIHKGNPKVCIGSTYEVKAPDPKAPSINDGMWMFVPAPRWMDDWTNMDPKAFGGNPDVNQALNKPSHSAVGKAESAFNRVPDVEATEYNDAMDKYAQMMYATNALRGREGALVGKLRFDVAPGTTIKIKARGDLMTGVDTLAVAMIGFVARVTVCIDAEQATASTSFELTNLRTEEENKSPRYAMPLHPFFKKKYFKYAPLVPKLSLPPDRS
jgi:hypothetical protein